MRLNTEDSQHRSGDQDGLDRRSCAWRDAVGSGFATGATQDLLDIVSRQARWGYCPA
jgi:hypothetical protein